MIKVSVNTAEFNKRILEYKANFKLNLKLVIREQCRLLLQQIIDLLPPKKRKDGVQAIRKDITKQFVDNDWLAENIKLRNDKLNDRVKEYLRTKNYDAIRQIGRDMHILDKVDVKDFSKSDIKRDGRGHIYQSGKKILPLNSKPLRQYVRTLEDNVGKLKASLKKGFVMVGGKLPAWINSKDSPGFVIDHTDDKEQPFLEIGSLLQYAKGVNSRFNVTGKALTIRSKAIVASIEKDVLNKAQKKFYGK